jgi:hypothetical protein
MINKNHVSTKYVEQLDKGTTLFLRAAIIGIALAALGLCVLILPAVYLHWLEELPDIARAQYPVLVALSLAAISFWIALLQGWKLLDAIDNGKVFSKASVKAIQTMKHCVLIISALFAGGSPVILYLAESDDAPGIILIYGTIFVAAPLVFGVALDVLQRLLKSAIDIKSENDLTV